MGNIQIVGIHGLPIIKTGNKLAEFICEAAKKQGSTTQDQDIAHAV